MRVLLGLTVAVAIAAAEAHRFVVDACVLPLLTGLMAAHIDREGRNIAEELVTAASRLLPARERDDFREEWIDHVRSAGEHGLRPLTRALSIMLIASPSLAIGLRLGRARQLG
jgi:hypothetical protein